MAKWYGTVGYIITTETSPGVWTPEPVEKEYFGEYTRNHSRWNSSQNLNDDITLQSEISFVCDPYALQNFRHIRYVTYMESYWKVTSVDVQYPRLILSVGGIYNGQTLETGPSGETGSDS